MSASITVQTRKRLWARSGNQCAYPGCGRELLAPTALGDDDTIVGKECHIVAQRDHPSVARAPCLLSEDEKLEWATLIVHRHSYANLVLMCGVHSDIIDDPKQAISVLQLVQIKRAHEEEVATRIRAQQADSARAAEAVVENRGRVVPLVLDDVGSWQRKAVLALAQDEPEALEWLRVEIGDPPDPDRIRDLIARWSTALTDSSDLLALAVIRNAEAVGLWSEAAEGWEHYSERTYDTGERADRLVRAAIDAQVVGEDDRYERLLEQAEDVDPDCPRLHLARVDPVLSPSEQLALLEEIESDNEPLLALVACQKALASLLIPDLEGAAGYLAEAKRLDPESVANRMVEVSLRVQSARIALISDRAFSLAEALSAREDALSLRDEMMTMGRWGESGRLLMLAADVAFMLRDLEGAESTLRRVESEELETREGALVLGEAALRNGAPRLALEFTEQAVGSEAIRRIRAAATVELGGPARGQALKTLEEIALSDSCESEQAAAERLTACMAPVRAPWSDQAAAVLASSRHAELVARLRLMAMASTGDFVEAERGADGLPDDASSAEVRLRIAGMRGQHSKMREAAERFLEFAPDAFGRLLAATALATAGELRRAGELTAQIAHDPNSPPRMRADAFATLLQTLADRNQWSDADREWQVFQNFSNRELRDDSRVSAWQVRILHHRGQANPGSPA